MSVTTEGYRGIWRKAFCKHNSRMGISDNGKRNLDERSLTSSLRRNAQFVGHKSLHEQAAAMPDTLQEAIDIGRTRCGETFQSYMM